LPSPTRAFTALELWPMKHPGGARASCHPQTQGKLERLHRSLKAELLQGTFFPGEEAAQRAFDAWRDDYNFRRPHEALAMRPPAVTCPRRACQPNPPPPDYADMRVRKAVLCGRLCFQEYAFRIGKAFCLETIGIQEKIEDGCYSRWWYSSRIGQIDMKNRSFMTGMRRSGHCPFKTPSSISAMFNQRRAWG
jgi:hypothetical protein